jgi:hypothetical protein
VQCAQVYAFDREEGTLTLLLSDGAAALVRVYFIAVIQHLYLPIQFN